MGKAADSQMNEALIRAVNGATAILKMDLNGDVTFANEKFLQLFEYASGSLEGRNHRIFVAQDEQRQSSHTDFWSVLQAGKPISAEFKRITGNNRDIWIGGNYVPVANDRGQIEAVILLAFDVTAVKLADRALNEKSLELEEVRHKAELSTTLNALVATYNHEINNSLSTAIGYLSATELKTETTEKLEAVLWKIAEVVKKMEAVASEMDPELTSYTKHSKMLKIA